MDKLIKDFDFITLASVCLVKWAEERNDGLTRGIPSHPNDCQYHTNENLAMNDEGRPLDIRFWRKFLEECATATTSVLKAALLANEYLGTLDLLKTSSGQKFKDALSIWQSLGSHAGLHESDLRAEAIAACRQANNGIAGCGWYKCILHLQETDQIMYHCIGCRKVAYCDFFCQERSVRLLIS